jgi:hypothetical protein
LEGSRLRATTDKQGRYAINYAPGTFKLVFTKLGYARAELNLNIAGKIEFPAKTVHMDKLPSGSGYFTFGPHGYLGVPEGVLAARPGASGRTNYVVSGTKTPIIRGGRMALMDTDGIPQRIYTVGSGGLLASLINVPSQTLGPDVDLWDLGSLHDGSYAAVTVIEGYPTRPIYLFEVRSDVSALIEKLRDPDAGTRRAAATALGQLGAEAESAVPELAKALTDPDAYVRELAALALGHVGAEAKSAVPALNKALKDPDHLVRAEAAKALSKIRSPKESKNPGPRT